jgi:hypothetical protein
MTDQELLKYLESIIYSTNFSTKRWLTDLAIIYQMNNCWGKCAYCLKPLTTSKGIWCTYELSIYSCRFKFYRDHPELIVEAVTL